MAHSVLVVPAFNEALRWNSDYWSQVATTPELSLLLVNDGSRDSTSEALHATAVQAPNISVLDLTANLGKGNAVRTGLLQALDSGAANVGFIDADGAFDPSEISSMISLFTAKQADELHWDALWTSRVALAGRHIHRRMQRHYIGRLVATAVSTGLPGVPYDTQSGFKLFRSSDTLRATLAPPFTTRWLFDVEILQRWWELTGTPMAVWEEPLMHWHDVPGSAITASSALSVGREVLTIARNNRRIAKRQNSAGLG